MHRMLVVFMLLAAVFLAVASLPHGTIQASHPSDAPRYLLNCPDVDGNGAAVIGDISRIVDRFGKGHNPSFPYTAVRDTNDPRGYGYHPLFDISGSNPNDPRANGSISIGDIAAAVSDFGLPCATLSPADSEIARATLDVIDATYHPPASLNLPDFPGDPGLLVENTALLASKGYFLGSADVPGQGKHYINPIYNADNLYYETTPEGLVYNDGKLSAQLYYIEGDNVSTDGDPPEGGVGWGPEPPPIEQVNIDAFCAPNYPNTRCSWGAAATTPSEVQADGWHLHENLCTLGIGTPDVMNWRTDTDQACADLQANGIDVPVNDPVHPDPFGGYYSWESRVGWMGHMWNHMLNVNVNSEDLLDNGRFADCFPDPWGTEPTEHYDGFSCPQ